MKNQNWGCALVGVIIVMIIAYLLGGCAYQQVSKQHPHSIRAASRSIPQHVIYDRKNIVLPTSANFGKPRAR